MTGRRKQAFINSAVTRGVPCSSAFRNSDWGVCARERRRRKEAVAIRRGKWGTDRKRENRHANEREGARRRRWMNRSYNRGGRSFFHVRIVSDRPNRRWVPARPRRIIYINAESPVINERYRLPLSVAIDEFPQTIPQSNAELICRRVRSPKVSIDRYSPGRRSPEMVRATIIVIKFLFASKMTCLKLPKMLDTSSL